MKLTFELVDGWSKVPAHCGRCDDYLINEVEVFEFMDDWVCKDCAEFIQGRALEVLV